MVLYPLLINGNRKLSLVGFFKKRRTKLEVNKSENPFFVFKF